MIRRALDWTLTAPGALPCYAFVALVLTTAWVAVGIGVAVVIAIETSL